MGQPAARVGDMHTCPMVDVVKPHVGGPVLPPGKINVLIGGMPAATVTNLCTCASVPDMILGGAYTVLIGGLPAARMGDMTLHGGIVTLGDFTVLIGGPNLSLSGMIDSLFAKLKDILSDVLKIAWAFTKGFFEEIFNALTALVHLALKAAELINPLTAPKAVYELVKDAIQLYENRDKVLDAIGKAITATLDKLENGTPEEKAEIYGHAVGFIATIVATEGIGELGKVAEGAELLTDAERAALKARSILSAATKAESAITEDIAALASKNGGKLEGLEYKLKSEESLTRKILKEGDTEINDALRYTQVYSEENIAKGASDTLAELEAKGYTIGPVKNTFKEGTPYKGINTTVTSPDGQVFELQFHTPESFAMKQNVNHPLYEEARTLDKTNPRKTELNDQMIENSNSVKIPPDIDIIKSKR